MLGDVAIGYATPLEILWTLAGLLAVVFSYRTLLVRREQWRNRNGDPVVVYLRKTNLRRQYLRVICGGILFLQGAVLCFVDTPAPVSIRFLFQGSGILLAGLFAYLSIDLSKSEDALDDLFNRYGRTPPPGGTYDS